MRIRIVTLVSDNYRNKYQNYAVEQLLSEHAQVITYRVEAKPGNAKTSTASGIYKFRPSHITEALRCRMMYLYDVTNMERSVFGNVIYVLTHKKKLLSAKQKRSEKFKSFEKSYLHISDRVISHENCMEKDWTEAHDFFVCGSDQIWNPAYGTTSDLAFLSFAEGKSVALAPSFGVSSVPKEERDKFRKWINGIDTLSVREDAGARIITDLTGREAQVLLDPTMAICAEHWSGMAKKPQAKLPEKYILTYFLGRMTKTYKNRIQRLSHMTGLPVVNLFDIERPEYYIFDPNEVLFAINNASLVLTDSFHGTVFSILFRRDFSVFVRDEGGESMHSRLTTLLGKLGLKDRMDDGEALPEQIPIEKWNEVHRIIESERQKTKSYIDKAVRGE